MKPRYDVRLNALASRRTTPAFIVANQFGEKLAEPRIYRGSSIYEVYNRIADNESVKYLVGAMSRIDPKYTELTFQEGERIKNQLEKALNRASASCDFEYQGSVTSDTHIVAHSDIDLLAITKRFWSLEPPQVPPSPYEGDPVEDLKEIRRESISCLKSAFPAAEVETGSKSICIKGGSLSRKIDVVPANWFDTNSYAQTQAKRFRAIQILDISTGLRVKNRPFLHNYLINCRDEETGGGLRKVIRLMKSLKYDNGRIPLSSFDIAAIGYNMPSQQLATVPGAEIPLLVRLKNYLDSLKAKAFLRDSLSTPDESRRIFQEGCATYDGLCSLCDEVDDLVQAISENRHRAAEWLMEARVSY